MSELQGQIDAEKGAHERPLVELGSAAKAVADQAQSKCAKLGEEHQAALAELNQAHDRFLADAKRREQEMQGEIEQLQAKHEAALQRLKAEISAKRQGHEARIAELCAAHNAKMARVRQAREAELATRQAEPGLSYVSSLSVEELARQIEDIKAEIERIRQRNDDLLRTREDQKQQQLHKLRDEHEQLIAKLRRDHADRTAELDDETTQKLANLRPAHKDRMRQVLAKGVSSTRLGRTLCFLLLGCSAAIMAIVTSIRGGWLIASACSLCLSFVYLRLLAPSYHNENHLLAAVLFRSSAMGLCCAVFIEKVMLGVSVWRAAVRGIFVWFSPAFLLLLRKNVIESRRVVWCFVLPFCVALPSPGRTPAGVFLAFVMGWIGTNCLSVVISEKVTIKTFAMATFSWPLWLLCGDSWEREYRRLNQVGSMS
jgi:hypothetical protein